MTNVKEESWINIGRVRFGERDNEKNPDTIYYDILLSLRFKLRTTRIIIIAHCYN